MSPKSFRWKAESEKRKILKSLDWRQDQSPNSGNKTLKSFRWKVESKNKKIPKSFGWRQDHLYDAYDYACGISHLKWSKRKTQFNFMPLNHVNYIVIISLRQYTSHDCVIYIFGCHYLHSFNVLIHVLTLFYYELKKGIQSFTFG